ncbi:hypothetical protein BGZ76_007948 [Entomortierella beljakovae]|nr:hypothetical protein BGZ76_007948 [Entomortierella beljakovae]
MAVNSVPGPVPGPNAGPGPGPGQGQGPVPAGGNQAPIVSSPTQRLDVIDEQVWIQLGTLAESMGEFDRAMSAYESALRHNHYSVAALNQIAELYRSRENFTKAADYFQRILSIDNASGEVWGSLGHCYLMMDELQKAYNAYQNALHHLPNPKDSKLWYGIGILYDRYGSVEHAEEAFTAVMRMDPKYEKANEIYFRLGIIYKGQQKYAQSLECFRYILHTPPRPLTEADIWFQIGHVHEQQKEYTSAKEAYERVLTENPNHAKVLQQLGWLYHQQNAAFMNQDLAIKFLTRSIESDNTDAQSWYLMGRCYMAQQKYNKAYEAYQQAVYRDSRNPAFWCSIGLLYFQINQYRDALDAYSNAIRINPNISEVWYDLGTLYEACNNQVNDAIDAYKRASDLDPENQHIKQRLAYLRQNNGAPGSGPPPPEEMSANAYPPTGPVGQHSFDQSASMNGEHSISGRDLPLPGNGNNGPASGSPGYLGDDRQPHIPGINNGGPRPPTPAGGMPQMMTGDRMQGPPQSLQPSASNHPRSSRGRPQSPATDGSGPYPRQGSPGMPHPSNGHGHDPHYPQHPYGHGPPHMMHGGPPPPPQGYERQDQGLRPKQEQNPQYQHHRQRSGEIPRPGPMDEGHGIPHPQRHHPSDSHGHAPSPPRDDRRAPMPGPGYNQHGQPSQQNPEERWGSTPNHHGRHPSDDQMRDGPRPQSGGERGPSMHRNPAGPEGFQGRNDIPQQVHGLEPDRRDQRSGDHSNLPHSRPNSDQALKDHRQGGNYDEQQHHARGREYETSGAYPDQRRSPSNWPPQENRSGGYREEDQDHDEIAASLVSLSGKAPSRNAHRPQDDDYEMGEPEVPNPDASRGPPRDGNSTPKHALEQQQPQQQPPPPPQQQQQQQLSQQQYHQQRHSPSPHDVHPSHENREPARSHSKLQHEQHQADHQQNREGAEEIIPEEKSARPSTPSQPISTPSVVQQHGSSPRDVEPQQVQRNAGLEADTSVAAATSEAKEKISPVPAENRKETEAPSHNGGDSRAGSIGATGTGPENGGSIPDTHTGPDNSSMKGPSEMVEKAPAGTEDEDTEMEEGEVREDEDEVMSSGAVSSTAQSKDTLSKEDPSK